MTLSGATQEVLIARTPHSMRGPWDRIDLHFVRNDNLRDIMILNITHKMEANQ
jgi:hypothetical protein